jgi:predicted RNA-binding Zn ribbon-like protein
MVEAMEWRIVGGHTALDLANTVAPRPPGTVEEDHLSDPAALLDWAQRAGVVDEAEAVRVAQAWAPEEALADALEIRAMVDDTLHGRRLAALTRRWAEAMARAEMLPRETGATLVVGGDPAMMIGDRLADALVDLLRHADLSRLRSCPLDEGGCGWLFLDRSRNQSRKWCTMEDCGTHAKSRRLTERRRSASVKQRAGA